MRILTQISGLLAQFHFKSGSRRRVALAEAVDDQSSPACPGYILPNASK